MLTHHGVRNLTSPKRVNAFVQAVWDINQLFFAYCKEAEDSDSPSDTLSGDDLVDSIESALGKRRQSGLHANLHSFERTETDISEEFGRCRSSEVDPSLVLDRVLGSSQVGIVFLEEFVATVLERSLDAITEESWRATRIDSTKAVCFDDFAPAIHVALVDLAVDLATTLDEIERCDGPVRETAGHEASESACLLQSY